MLTLVCWQISGQVHPADRSRSGTERTVLLAVGSDISAAEVMSRAEEALLHNWSAQPHTAEVLSVARTDTTVQVVSPS